MRGRLFLAVAVLIFGAGSAFSQATEEQPSLLSSATATADAESTMLTNPFSNPEGMLDRLVIVRTADEFASGTLNRVKVENDPYPRVVLADDNRSRFPRSGSWISPQIEADYPFTEFLPSWNVDASEETGFAFSARVRIAETGEWSPWLYMGQWGKTLHYPSKTISFEDGKVNVDNIRLERPADAFQLRANLYSFDLTGEAVPALRLYAASYSGVVEDKELYRQLKERVIVDGPWARSLPVPFYAQYNNGEAIRGETCSPTSTSMLISYRGIGASPLENCMEIYDPEYGIFGNWARAVARASELGLEGWLTRVRDLDQVKQYIAAGQPIIASIKFREGEFPSNPMKSTNGHLIVIRGLTEDGDAIVNDPAHREAGNGIVYKWEELKEAWVGRGGVAYIIGNPVNGRHGR
jgi:hypothetical protein